MFEAVELAEAARKAAGADVALVSDAELCDAVVELAAARAAVEAAEAHVLAELDVRGATDREFGSPTLWWVTAQTRAPRPAVAARLRLGMRLRHLDVVDEALADGRLTAEHARAVADTMANPRIADDVVAVQGDLVALAQQCPFRVWRHHLRVVEQLLDQDGSFDPDRELARNQLRVSPNGGDGICLSGELVGEHALGFTQLLEAETDRWWRRARADHDESPDLAIPSRSTLRALALVELLRKGSAGQPPAAKAPSSTSHWSCPPTGPTKCRPSTAPSSTPTPPRHLGCDPTITAIDVDDDGNPLRVGRQHRLLPPLTKARGAERVAPAAREPREPQLERATTACRGRPAGSDRSNRP